MPNLPDELVSLVQQLRDRLAHLETTEVSQRWAKDTSGALVPRQLPTALAVAGVPFSVSQPALYCRFDGPRPFNANFTGTPHSFDGQRVVESGPIIYRQGRYGKAVQVARAGRNRCYNPRFNGNISHVTQTGGAGFASYDSGSSEIGAGSLYLPGDATVAIDYEAVALDTTVTISLSYRFKFAGQGGGFNLGDMGGGSWKSVGNTDNEWHRVHVTTLSKSLNVFHIQTPADCRGVYIDAVQVEENAVPTPYMDGDLGLDHYWTGQPHNSPSERRAGASLKAGHIALDFRSFTIGAWVWTDWRFPGGGGNDQCVVCQKTSGTDDQYLQCLLRYNRPYLGFWADDLHSDTELENYRWYHLVFQYDLAANAQRIYIDGKLDCERTPSSAFVGWAGDTYIGTGHPDDWWMSPLDGRLSDLFIVQEALTPAQIMAIYASGTDVLEPREYYPAPGARVAATAQQLIPNATWQALSYNSIQHNSYAVFNPDKPTQLFAPIAGLYYVSGHVAWPGNPSGIRILAFCKNGTRDVARSSVTTVGANYEHQQSLGALVAMEAGDYLELRVWQDAGVSLYVQVQGDYSPDFAMAWIGD